MLDPYFNYRWLLYLFLLVCWYIIGIPKEEKRIRTLRAQQSLLDQRFDAIRREYDEKRAEV